MNHISKKKAFLLAGLLVVSLFANGLAYSVVLDDEGNQSRPDKSSKSDTFRNKDEGKIPPHVPGEILVKFKDGADPVQVLKEINHENK